MFCFGTGISYFGKFVPKNQNCQIILKFGFKFQYAEFNGVAQIFCI